MKKWQEKAIKEIMDEFDFKRVHATMVALNWQWATPKYHIPDIKELKKEAATQLKRLCDEKGLYLASGGFEYIENKEFKQIKLRFVVEDWSVNKSDLI